MRRRFGLFLSLLLVGVVFAVPRDPAEYARWKREQSQRKSTMLLGPIENDYVAVQVDNSTVGENGCFNIGTSSTHPVFPDTCLLYHYPWDPWSSHAVFQIDGEFYSYSDHPSPASAYTLLSSPDIPFSITTLPGDSSYIEGGWIIGDVTILQRLQPVYLVNAYGDVTGSVYIRYTIINNSATTTHQVGVLLEMDTMVGNNDRAPLATPYGYAAVEQEFVGDEVPAYWQAGEEPFPWDPTDLVAQGYLSGYDAVRPDRFLVGWWPDYDDVVWDYTPSFMPYTDSAVLIYWYPRPVAPGETTYVATYYGLGLPERTPPDVHFVEPPLYDTVACSDQFIRVATFDSTGIDSTSFTITVNGSTFVFPDHITSYRSSDTLYFVWQPDEGFFGNVETVDVYVSVSDLWGTSLLEPVEWHFIVDTEGPRVLSWSLAPGCTVANPRQPVDAVIVDNFAGVDSASLLVSLTTSSGTSALLFPGGGLSWEAATNTLHINPADVGISFEHGDSIHVQVVRAYDKTSEEYCGPNNVQPNGLWFYFRTEPPQAFLVDPPESSITACVDQRILIAVQCTLGIVPDSIKLYVNGEPFVYGDPEITFYNDTIEFNPPGTQYFSDGQVTVNLLPLYDIYGSPSPEYSWVFFVDATHPTLSNPLPAPGVEVEDVQFDVSFVLSDEGPIPEAVSGLDTGSVQVWVTNSEGTFDVTAYLSHTENLFGFNTADASLSFLDNEVVTVRVRAADAVDTAYCGPNVLDTTWTFVMSETPCYRGTNPITPNGDTYNDYTYFKFPNMRSARTEKKIYIYDRYNHLVRTIEGAEGGRWIWDGTDDNGDVVPQGVYIYLVVVDGEVVCNGTISVAR